MKVIGFNFTRMSAFRDPFFRRGSISTDVQFTEMEKDKADLLKDSEISKLTFKFSINYNDAPGKQEQEKPQRNKKQSSEAKRAEDKTGIFFEGKILLSVTNEELKNLQKTWKKKQLPSSFQMPLYNLILKKCSIRAAQLAEEINLPPHLPIPQLKPK